MRAAGLGVGNKTQENVDLVYNIHKSIFLDGVESQELSASNQQGFHANECGIRIAECNLMTLALFSEY